MRKLTANDICRDVLHCGHQSCALGWMETAAKEDRDLFASLRDKLRAAVGEDSIMDWNDNSNPQVVADTLNTLFEKEGICVS